MLIAIGGAEMRPRYGDTLRIDTRSAAFLVPGSYGADDSLSRLIFDTLTTTDGSGNIRPGLATSWQADGERRRWQFWLRRNVTWHDGSVLAATEVAQIIGAANEKWKARAVGDSVVVETDTPAPGLAAEVAMMRNAIVRTSGDGIPVGTGPYKIASNANGNVVLRVNPDHWRGRGFIDTVEITTGKALRDQGLDADLGRSDMVEATVEDLRRNTSSRLRVAGSKPVEVMALVFASRHDGGQDERAREAISLSLDRNSIQSVFLQRQGEASAAILPNWMSGYGSAFPATQDLPRARELRMQSTTRAQVAIGYTSNDALAKTIAERVVLNVRDAGFAAQVTGDPATADAVVERITLRSADPFAALLQVASEYGLSVEFKGITWQDLFNAERDLLARRVIVPIVHLPRVYAAGVRARNFRVEADGAVDIQKMWVVRSEARGGGAGAR